MIISEPIVVFRALLGLFGFICFTERSVVNIQGVLAAEHFLVDKEKMFSVNINCYSCRLCGFKHSHCHSSKLLPERNEDTSDA